MKQSKRLDILRGFSHQMISCTDTNGVLSDIAKFTFSEELSDVTIRVGGKELKAHKFVLAARSKPFKAMLYGNMAEATSGIVTVCIL